MLNEKWQIILADFGTSKHSEIPKDNVSDSSSGKKSDLSYISGLSNISGLSGISGMSQNDQKTPFNAAAVDKERILNEDIVGSEHYISPEMLLKRESCYASDLWALGVIIYQFLAD